MEAETVCTEKGTDLRDVLEEAEEVRRTRMVLLAEKKGAGASDGLEVPVR